MIYCCKIAQKLLSKGSFPKIKHKSQEMYVFYALININRYGTCRKYCASLGLMCRNAFEEKGDSCTIESDHGCDKEFIWTSYALCQCQKGIGSAGITSL